MTKTCTKCGAVGKAGEVFYAKGAECKVCLRARARATYNANAAEIRAARKAAKLADPEKATRAQREWRARNPGIFREHTWRRQGIVGMTYARYLEIFQAQGGLCLLCLQAHATLCVDHCHTTGRIRGLLCQPCNTALGGFKDSPEMLARALQYLINASEKETGT